MDIAVHGITYEDYMCGPEEMRRYDILDGEKIYMPSPTVEHQDIQGNLYIYFRALQRKGFPCKTVQAPCDVLIRRRPLRTRQPDVLFISNQRFGGRSRKDPSPLDPAPELVVEILSPSNTPAKVTSKLDDYLNVGVLECWIVNADEESVEVLRLTATGTDSAGIYVVGQSVQSVVFPDLSVEVAVIFEL